MLLEAKKLQLVLSSNFSYLIVLKFFSFNCQNQKRVWYEETITTHGPIRGLFPF